jgi:C1A family cysteine protease
MYTLLNHLSKVILISMLLSLTFARENYQGNYPTSADPPVSLTPADNGAEITLATGTFLELVLPANPSTGYMWDLSALDLNLFRFVERTFEPESDLTGAPGMETIRLQVWQPGATRLVLAYRRSWESGVPALNTFEVQVTILGEPMPPTGPGNVPGSPLPAPETTADRSTTDLSLPDSYDWRNLNGVTPIKNQGGCGSCWAFATVGVLEAAQKIHTGQDVDLSEQFLLGHNESNWSCSGGGPAFDHHNFRIASLEREAGLLQEADCPYRSNNTRCPGSQPYRHPYTIDASIQVQASTAAIKQAILQYGPVYTNICTGPGFSAYRSGVFEINESSYCNGGTNHAVVLVGWDDTLGSQGAWFLRNSWGTSWGDNGYMNIGYGISNVGRNNLTAIYDGDPLSQDVQYGGVYKELALDYPYAYVGIGNRLGVFDVSEPAQPVLVGTSTPLPDTITGVTLQGAYAYVTSYWRGLSVFDISSPTMPNFVYSDYYSSGSFGEDVAISGQTAYYIDNFHLNILSLADPARPARLGSMTTSGHPIALEVSGNYAYVASWSVGLNVINVANPASPISVALLDTPGYAVDIAIQGMHAYIADRAGGLRIIDISNPAVPVEVAVYDTPGSAEGVEIAGTRAYVADGESGLLVLDISNPTAPVYATSMDTPGKAYSLVAAGDLLYLTDGEAGLRVLDISETPFVESGSYAQLGIPLDVETIEDILYAAAGAQGLSVLDTSQLPDMVETSRLPALTSLTKLALEGEYLIGLDSETLRLFSLVDPLLPQPLAALPVGEVSDLAVLGDYAYLAAGTSGIKIIGLHEPTNPQDLGLVSLTPSGGRAKHVQARANFLYVLAEPVPIGGVPTGGGLFVLDASLPEAPQLIQYWPATTTPTDFALVENYAVVAETTSWWEGDFSLGGVHVLDLSSSPDLQEVARILISEGNILAAEGKTVYIIDDGRGVVAFNLENPAEPRLQASLRFLGGMSDLHIAGNRLWISTPQNGLQVAWRLEDRKTAYIPPEGGVLSGKSDQAQFVFPAGAFAAESAVTFHQYLHDPLIPGMEGVGLNYNLMAVTHADSQFATPLLSYTAVLSYTPGLVPEASLKLFHLEGNDWMIEDTSQVDVPARRVTAAPDQLGKFAVLSCLPPGNVVLSGPPSVSANTPAVFTAEASPITLAGPLIFTWIADEHDPVEITQDSLVSEVSFTWTTPGQKQVTVEVENCGGSAAASVNVVINLPVPDIPAGLLATAGEFTGQVWVTWNASSNAETYQLFRSVDTTPPESPLVTLSGTNYSDTQAAPGLLYHYWVTACNPSGCSGYSQVEDGFRALESPANLQAGGPLLPHQVGLTWESVTGASWYQVYRPLTGSPPDEPLADQLAFTNYQDFDVDAGKTYTYWVKACCDIGCSGLSIPAQGQTAAELRVFLPIIGH